MKQLWTDERIRELEKLSAMLKDISSLNRGNNFLDKVDRCITDAENLRSSDLRARKTSFVSFLEDLAQEALSESNDDPYPLDDQDNRMLNAATDAFKGGDPDALALMNSLCQWQKPPPQDERWLKKMATACEMAVAFCKLAENYKARINQSRSK